jgi:hypothetical protein
MAKNDNSPATKADVKEIVTGALREFWDSALEPMFTKILGRLDKMEGRLDKVETRLTKVEFGQRDIKRRLNDLKMDTPTRREFDELRGRVGTIAS